MDNSNFFGCLILTYPHIFTHIPKKILYFTVFSLWTKLYTFHRGNYPPTRMLCKLIGAYPHFPTYAHVDEETDSDFFDEETMYDDDSSYTDIGSGQYVYEYDMADGSHLYLCGSELSVPQTTIYIVDADGKTTQIK